MQRATAKVSLEHVRALILRGTLGAMRTTPVVRVLLNVEPLHLTIMAAAASSAYRLGSEGKWKVGTRHTKFPEGVLSHEVFRMGQDKMPIVRSLEAPFKVCFPEREEWLKPQGPVLNNGVILFTDGFRTSSGSGAGIYCRSKGIRESISLGKFATVFQAEIVAIMCCAQNLLAMGERGKRISICSDSQAALRALSAPTFTYRLVWDCRRVLEVLAMRNEVALVWVPGHSGIKGNKAADQLAKAGAEAKLTGPEPAVGVPCCVGREIIRTGCGTSS